MPNYSTLWPAEPVLRTFVQNLIAFCSNMETASDVISGNFVGSIVPDKLVKCRDLLLNRSREILPKAVGDGILTGFFHDNFGPEVGSDVISGVDVDEVGIEYRCACEI